MKKTLLIVLISSLLLISTLAILTKIGILPNYLAIEILCPEKTTLPQGASDSSSDTTDWLNDVDEIGKPVIYLYPQTEQKVTVSIEYSGEMFVTYPQYQNGWEVIAKPDGKLINSKDGREYSYLFWEGRELTPYEYDMSTGFVVKGSDTLSFLQNKLSELGLLPNEYNEFIVYWLPHMIENEYNLIHFATTQEYADRVKLDISPTPDSVLRLFMVFQDLDQYIQVEPQILPSFERNGFTVVEWGGTEI